MAVLTSNSNTTAVDIPDIGLICIAATALTVALVAITGNIALLLSATQTSSASRRKGAHHWLQCSYAAANLLACFAWTPLYAAQLVFGGMQREVIGTAMCRVTGGLFHLSVVSAALSLCLLAAGRLWCDKNAHVGLIRVTVCWLLGLMCAGVVITNFRWSVEHAACDAVTAFQPVVSLAVIIFVIVVVVITAAVAIARHQLGRQRSAKYNTTTNTSEDAQTVLLPTGNCSPKSDSNHKQKSDDEDDDSFDEQMRMKMRKISSARRHTVANVGAGLGGSPRSALGVVPHVGSNYRYIRKWSVDITALQDQLENPRMHTSSPVLPAPSDYDSTIPVSSQLPAQMEPLNSTHSAEPLPTVPIPTIVVNSQPAEDSYEMHDAIVLPSWRMVILLTVTAASLLPHCFGQLLAMTGTELTRLVIASTSAICLIPAVFAYPMLANRPCHVTWPQWKCVCYCHVSGQSVECCGSTTNKRVYRTDEHSNTGAT